MRAVLALTLIPLLSAAIPGDPPDEIDDWRASFERGRGPVLDDLEVSLIELRGYARLSTAHRQRATAALLDLSGAGIFVARDGKREEMSRAWRVVDRMAQALERLRRTELDSWVATEILPREGERGRRVAAARYLGGSESSLAVSALKMSARDEDEAVREACLEALIGEDDDGVHGLFVKVLEEHAGEEPTLTVALAEDHFRQVRMPKGCRSIERLVDYITPRIAGKNWRDASQAANLTGGLPDDFAVELLIGALESWSASQRPGEPVKRVQYDIERQLQERSGLDLGVEPSRWRTWWSAAQKGSVPPVAEARDRTHSSFFGLRPTTDRLIFVLDRSGSMTQPFGDRTNKTSRWEEALDQMEQYLLRVGPTAEFNLVLFSDGAMTWRRTLQPANKSNLTAARAWAERRPPEGGTHLRTGVENALRLRHDGSVDLSRLDADTLVVLCDGRTDEGTAWVAPTMRRVNPKARVVIHGVQIGDGGDDTLRLLASITGGRFVEVDNDGR